MNDHDKKLLDYAMLYDMETNCTDWLQVRDMMKTTEGKNIADMYYTSQYRFNNCCDKF